MVTNLQLLPYTNSLIFLFALPAAYVNFSIYRRLKLKDNLLAGMYFISDAGAALSIAIRLNYYEEFVVPAAFFTMLAEVCLFLIAIRILWTHPPWYIYPIILIFLIGFVNVLLADTLADFENIADVSSFFGISELTFIFVIVAVMASKTPVTITRVRITKLLWIMYPTLKLIGHSFYILRRDILQAEPTVFPWFFLVILPQIIAAFLIMVLHVFYPEAMLISEEQLYRARDLYTRIQKIKIDEAGINIGVSGVLSYLKSIPSDIMYQEVMLEDQDIIIPK